MHTCLQKLVQVQLLLNNFASLPSSMIRMQSKFAVKAFYYTKTILPKDVLGVWQCSPLVDYSDEGGDLLWNMVCFLFLRKGPHLEWSCTLFRRLDWLHYFMTCFASLSKKKEWLDCAAFSCHTCNTLGSECVYDLQYQLITWFFAVCEKVKMA